MVDFQLLSVLKCLINENANEKPNIDDWKSLIWSARKNGMLPCVAYYCSNLPDDEKPQTEIAEFLKKALIQSTVLSVKQLSAVEELSSAYEKKQLYNLIAKGTKTKTRYPNDVLRSMGDIDLLYKPIQHKEVYNLMLNLGFGDYQEGRKNDTYTRDKYIIVEAHRQLVSTESRFTDYLDKVWERAVLCKDTKFTYEMTLEDEFIYNIIHLSEHFKDGGVGVRFVMDIWVYNHIQMDRNYLNTELEKLDLLDLYNTFSRLAEYWFGDGESDELLEKLGEFIFSSGIFGNRENVASLAVDDGGKLKSLIKSCFPNLKAMASMFTWLDKYPFLLPFAWILRIFRSITRRKDVVKTQLTNIKNFDADRNRELRDFQKECGLK